MSDLNCTIQNHENNSVSIPFVEYKSGGLGSRFAGQQSLSHLFPSKVKASRSYVLACWAKENHFNHLSMVIGRTISLLLHYLSSFHLILVRILIYFENYSTEPATERVVYTCIRLLLFDTENILLSR